MERGRRAAAKLLTRNEARLIAANIAKLLEKRLGPIGKMETERIVAVAEAEGTLIGANSSHRVQCSIAD